MSSRHSVSDTVLPVLRNRHRPYLHHVSNLKMATDTLLEKPMTEAERTDFLRGTVSYTHLDVYKRQEAKRMRLIGKLLALPFMLVTGILYLVCKFLVVLSLSLIHI